MGDMQRLHYTGDTLLMPDAVCEAVMDFARALAGTRTSDVVRVPVVDESGILTEAVILIGPASQLYAMPAPDVSEIEVDPRLLEDIVRRAAELAPARSGPDHAATRHEYGFHDIDD